ncbi:MAG: hypothetical protein ACOZEN_15085 [Thermodesulfobacteriota bacterium]
MTRYIETYFSAEWMLPLGGIMASIAAAYAAHKIVFHVLNKSGYRRISTSHTLWCACGTSGGW